jgi:ribonuclease T1
VGSRKRITLALVGLVVLVIVGWLVKENTGDSRPPSSPSTSTSSYPYREDGKTFQNREGLLPHEKTGYYREYTVDTPGSDDRGAQRLIYGSGKELYYTGDHYKSFVVVDPEH